MTDRFDEKARDNEATCYEDWATCYEDWCKREPCKCRRDLAQSYRDLWNEAIEAALTAADGVHECTPSVLGAILILKAVKP